MGEMQKIAVLEPIMKRLGCGNSILFVDDERSLRDLFERALTAQGIQFQAAADGNEALVKLEQQRFDAVVIDILMPDREGVETIVEIRKRRPETFIIAISGGGMLGSDEFLKLAMMVGADCTLTKPFTPTTLLATLAVGRPPSVAVN
jgi:DNA-binding response OmpR family regulator